MKPEPRRLKNARSRMDRKPGAAARSKDGVFLDHVPVLFSADFYRLLFSDPDHRRQERRHASLLARLLRLGRATFLLILLFSIVFNYGAAIVIDRNSGAARKWALALAVAVNLLVLGVFKYANFVTANFAALLKPLGWDFGQTNIELPLGISFFTFHCLSYIIDVYRVRFRANRDPVDVALYISLFPQLVAGPIVRYKTVARQLDARRRLWDAPPSARASSSSAWPRRC